MTTEEYFDLNQQFSKDIMYSTIEEEKERQYIENVVAYLKKDLEQFTVVSASTLNVTHDQHVNHVLNIMTTNNNQKIQQNIDYTKKFINQQQFELFNSNNLSISSNSIDMDIDNNDKDYEQISSSVDAITSMKHTFDSINKNNSEQQMTALDYCRWMLTKLNLAITALEPVLVNLGISTEIADSYLKTFEIPSPEDIHITAQEPLKILSNLFQMSINILPSFRQINNVDDFNNTIPIGQELNETPERTIGAPSEQNECHFNGEIQAIISSNLPRFFNSKDTCLTISLSELLLQAQKYVQEIELAELKIYEQPQEFWKKRSINCLKNKWCPAIHGRSGKQRHYIGIKWSKFIDSNPNNLFVFVQLLSYDNQSHLSKVLVPPETTVKQIKSSEKKQQRNNRRQTLSDLIIKDIYGFDKTTNTILCPITEDEYRRCQKNLKVLMFSLYKTSEEIENLNSIQDLNDNQTVNKDEDNEIFADEDEDSSMENQLLKLCKLRIRLCRRTDENTLEYISNFIDTEWIEE
ncbi:unnamed protein product, partial [Rotaria sp. Silwood1]